MRASMKSSAVVRPLWVRVAQLFSLIVWLVGATPVLPGMAAVAADLDGQLQVLLMRTESGMSVVLHHGSGNQAPDHRHSVVSDFLSMVGADGGMGPDHVLMFSEGEASRDGTVSEAEAGRGVDAKRGITPVPPVRLLSAVDFLVACRSEMVGLRGGCFRGRVVERMAGGAISRSVCLRI
jgi:hypothetical protein